MKKLLFAVPVVLLLAAGCNSTVQSPTTPADNTTPSQEMSPTPTPSGTMPTAMPSTSASGTSMSGSGASVSSTWQATLMASNDSAKGKYMITSGGHTIYLNTSRDYSSLVGKMVNVSYTGTMTGFSLGDITAQ